MLCFFFLFFSPHTLMERCSPWNTHTAQTLTENCIVVSFCLKHFLSRRKPQGKLVAFFFVEIFFDFGSFFFMSRDSLNNALSRRCCRINWLERCWTSTCKGISDMGRRNNLSVLLFFSIKNVHFLLLLFFFKLRRLFKLDDWEWNEIKNRREITTGWE